MSSGMPDEELHPATPLSVAVPIRRVLETGPPEAQATALVFRSLGHPLRLQILSLLHHKGSTSRAQLAVVLQTTWSLLEHHLKALERDGFIIASGQGRSSCYTLSSGLMERIAALCAPNSPADHIRSPLDDSGERAD